MARCRLQIGFLEDFVLEVGSSFTPTQMTQHR